jgi:hypothetical protein
MRWIAYRVSIMKARPEWSDVPKNLVEQWELVRIPGRWKEDDEDDKKQKEKCVIS